MKNIRLKVNNYTKIKIIHTITFFILCIYKHFSTDLFLKNPLLSTKKILINISPLTNNSKYIS